jgi:large subunit ribosomal protein L20
MRVTIGAARRRKNKRLFKEARGNRGGRSKLLRTVKETIIRARVFAYRDRRNLKREMRALWITRIKAACVQRGLRYSQFIHGLQLAGIELNRKSLSELAIQAPGVFDEIAEAVKAELEQPVA